MEISSWPLQYRPPTFALGINTLKSTSRERKEWDPLEMGIRALKVAIIVELFSIYHKFSSTIYVQITLSMVRSRNTF